MNYFNSSPLIYHTYCYISFSGAQPDLYTQTAVPHSKNILCQPKPYPKYILEYWSVRPCVFHYTLLECPPFLYLPAGNQYPYFSLCVKAFPEDKTRAKDVTQWQAKQNKKTTCLAHIQGQIKSSAPHKKEKERNLCLLYHYVHQTFSNDST